MQLLLPDIFTFVGVAQEFISVILLSAQAQAGGDNNTHKAIKEHKGLTRDRWC